MLMDSEELPLTNFLEWPRWWQEDICRCPVDQLWPRLCTATKTGVVEIRLQFGNAMARGVGPSEGVGVVPRIIMIVELGATRAAYETR